MVTFIYYKNKHLIMKTLNQILNDGIKSEVSAIGYYHSILLHIKNGNHKRSLTHILNEEKEHLETLRRIKKELGI